jgi:hypothetical protein
MIPRKGLLFIFVISSSILLASISTAKEMETIAIPGFATFKYEKSVKLKRKGCQRIPFQYVTEDSLPRENTGMAVLIDNGVPKDGIAYALSGWFTKLTYEGAPKIDYVWPRIGTIDLKVCRRNWQSGEGSSINKFKKVKPGEYEITFTAFYIDEKMGKPKNELVLKSKIIFD